MTIPTKLICLESGMEYGEEFLVDKQIYKIHGKNEYKNFCGKFKRIWDWIQADHIAKDGFILDSYYRSEPLDKQLLAQGFCPWHCSLIHMLKNLKDICHDCKMDNLFISMNSVWAASSLPQKVKFHGDIRKNDHDVPPTVFKDEVKGKQTNAVQGTVKAAVLDNDSLSHDLITA